ncbi:aspartyl protease family protein [Dyella japonica]|uniref:Clan AA aspartic protease (TIGR02281 family) n=1 Tax=Dyella japonica TaxID=231455 RepID=A0ABV2JND0_9GAMM
MGNKHSRGWTGLAGMLLAAVSSVASGATGDTRPALPGSEGAAQENTDLQAILKAMQSADAEALTRLYKESQDPVIHVWSAMALERVRFNLDAASADASTCENALIDVRPGIALSCGQFRVGNLQLAGRWADSHQAESELIARFRGHGVDKRLDNMQAYLNGIAGQPALSYDMPAGDVTLKLEPRAKSKPMREEVSTIPRFTVSANGHEVEAMLDTGASDMILGQEDAERLGVTPLDRQGHVNGWLAKDVPTQAGRLDTLAIGSITLHNVPVTVVPRPIVLIGGNLVAPLGTLKITQSDIQIYGKDSLVPACDTPMRVSTALWGNSLRLYPQLLVNDTPQSVMLDTGAQSYLIGTRAALDEVTPLHRMKTSMKDIGGSHAFVNADAAKVKLTIANQPFDMTFEVYTDADNIKHPITLGAGALRDMDFLLDFRHQRQCFLLHPDLR